ncbi:hypothetical protein [Caulobacter soli]|uniref:hypothetical protein n=1 Tax=Caulobacter soli TaxID=2708539 RepID=UPI0013EB508B|nr:hypothetical protein [Caulobacter soli]
MILLLALALSPLVQTGLSYWVSCGTLLSLMTIYAARRNIAVALRRPMAAFVLLIFVAMYFSVLTSATNDPVHDLLLVTRQGVIFALLCLIMLGSDLGIKAPSRGIITTIAIITGGMLVLTAIQSVVLQKVYIGIPKSFFIQNENTLPTLLDMIYARIRPMGTFGEPSYLGFYSTSLIFVLLGNSESGKFRKISNILIFGNIAIGLLSQSMAFVVAITITLLVHLSNSKSFKRWMSTRTHIPVAIGITAILALITLASLGKFEGVRLFDRVGTIMSGNDFSANVRIFYPLQVLLEYIFAYPFGSANSELLYNVSDISMKFIGFPIKSIDNALITASFLYGFVGLLVIVTLGISARTVSMLAYLFVCANFNGALLSVDKLAIVSLAVLLHSHFTHLARNGGGEEDRITLPPRSAIT